MEQTETIGRTSSRRSFVLGGLAVGAGTIGAARLLADPSSAFGSGGLTPGDAAILRFLAAAEILETDLWQQYNELGGIQDSEVPSGRGTGRLPGQVLGGFDETDWRDPAKLPDGRGQVCP